LVDDPGLPNPPAGALGVDGDRDSLREPQRILACELYSRLTKEPFRKREDNLVFSPYGIRTALALASAASRGETARELLAALGTDLAPERLHAAMAAQRKALPMGALRGIDLRMANSLWVQRGSAWPSEDFARMIKQLYAAEIADLDFGWDGSRVAINKWVASRTDGRIRDFIEPHAFNESTNLALVNVVSFRGTWESPFQRDNTQLRRFHAPDGPIDTPTMYAEESWLHYSRVDGLEILWKGYSGGVGMAILLPAADANFTEFEKTLTPVNLRRWLGPAKEHKVSVYLPRFKIDVSEDLVPVLSTMGVNRAFSAKDSDFSGVSPDAGLFLQRFKHKAEVTVDEKGTVAVALTGQGFGGSRIFQGPPEIVTFQADRPFVFLIHDARTDTILFMGRVMNPTR